MHALNGTSNNGAISSKIIHFYGQLVQNESDGRIGKPIVNAKIIFKDNLSELSFAVLEDSSWFCVTLDAVSKRIHVIDPISRDRSRFLQKLNDMLSLKFHSKFAIEISCFPKITNQCDSGIVACLLLDRRLHRCLKQRTVSSAEVKKMRQMIHSEMMEKRLFPRDACGLTNEGNTCYVNSVLQSIKLCIPPSAADHKNEVLMETMALLNSMSYTPPWAQVSTSAYAKFLHKVFDGAYCNGKPEVVSDFFSDLIGKMEVGYIFNYMLVSNCEQCKRTENSLTKTFPILSLPAISGSLSEAIVAYSKGNRRACHSCSNDLQKKVVPGDVFVIRAKVTNFEETISVSGITYTLTVFICYTKGHFYSCLKHKSFWISISDGEIETVTNVEEKHKLAYLRFFRKNKSP
jgi:hypothetical protein